MITNKYPYTDLHELNLDWILDQIKSMNNTLNNFINFNSIKYADPISWDITHQYEANTVVIDSSTGDAYLSKKAVSSGININNSEYWTPIFNYDEGINKVKKIIPYYNVISFGAVGDGITDDTNAIKEAISKMTIKGGGVLYFPTGTYLITEPLMISTVCTILGDSIDSSNINVSIDQGDAITLNTWKSCITNIKLTTNTSGYAVNLNAPHTQIINTNIVCLNGVKMSNVLNKIFDSNIMCPNGIGIYLSGFDSSCTIAFNEISSGLASRDDSAGIFIEAGNSSAQILYNSILLKGDGVRFNTDSSAGIFSNRIIGNFIDNCKNASIITYGSGVVYRSIIKDNWLGGGCKFGISDGSSSKYDGLQLEGNEFYITTECAINIPKSTDSLIKNNSIANGYTGINIENSATDCKIIGNIFGNIGGESEVQYGIFISSEPNSYIIKDNDFTGSVNKITGLYSLDSQLKKINENIGYYTMTCGVGHMDSDVNTITVEHNLPFIPTSVIVSGDQPGFYVNNINNTTFTVTRNNQFLTYAASFNWIAYNPTNI